MQNPKDTQHENNVLPVPDVAFLGVCDRSAHIREGAEYQWKINILGLRNIILSPVFPIPLTGFQIVLAVYNPFYFQPAQIQVVSSTGENVTTISLVIQATEKPVQPIQRTDIVSFTQHIFPVWTPLLFTFPTDAGFVKEPGVYKLVLVRAQEQTPIGDLSFIATTARPLSNERITAIKSNPLALKFARFILSCKVCRDEFRTYTGIERVSELESEKYIWYLDLPGQFTCMCGSTTINLSYLRANMHAVLENATVDENISFTRLYETDALEAVGNAFAEVLSRNAREERVQKFIEQNPIVLQSFGPAKIFFKSPILSRYNTDIVVLNQKGELLLIELERPGIPLLKKDGGISAETQHALDQVRDWLFTCDHHRAAVLEGIGLKNDEVSAIRGIAILGRDSGYNDAHLRRLKWLDLGRISIFTYDDIMKSFIDMVRRVKAL